MKLNKVLYFGSLPPPVGGVSVFNKKFVNYLYDSNYLVHFFYKDLDLMRYDTSYINYSKPWKRFLAVCIARIRCCR